MPPAKILVVDDQPVNVQLLQRKLEREGMAVLTAESGQDALDLVRRDPPDLILLDIMMPDMDGFDVCQHLQADPLTRAIPVIFVTARGTKESKLEGLATGAVDYITKPVDLDEMLARVQTQLRVLTINREKLDLEQRLAESRHAATIGSVSQGIAHNLNNLLAVVLGYIDLIRIQAAKPEQVKSHAANVENAIKRIAAVIKQLNLLAIETRPPTTAVPLGRLLAVGVARFQSDHHIADAPLIENPLGELIVHVQIEAFERILSALLLNAWESYGDAPSVRRTIELRSRRAVGAKFIEILIEDRGRGIAPGIRAHMFEPFVSTKQHVGVGMGLTIARHSLRNMGGDLALSDRQGGGTTATITYPLA
ncbi:MAG: hybrid sensor histidine kinase/response regulator [Opitutaceae bacterium]|jgi:DNA-binding response OmpR family regulator|nr:hybrid sensor histidine kinase/response regulator [Opitutaceae bacterium]